MKITNLISMLAAASAVGFCMSATAGEGQSGTLVLADPVTNVSVTTSASSGGSWNNPAPDIVDGYFEIDCDAATSNQFTATSITDSKVVKCEFVLMPSPVPYTGSLPDPDSDAQVAFCIATNTTSGGASTLQAYVGGDWKTLTGAVPTEEYTLTITLDYSGTIKYAKFAINGNPLKYNSDTWIQTGKNSATGIKDYCFVGSGSLKSILTTGQNIAAEEATVGGYSVAIPEEAIAVAGGSASSAATELAKTSSVNSMTKLENYIIFGMNDAGTEIKEEAKPVAKAATVGQDGAIKLNFTNVAAKEVAGTTVKYTLLGKVKSTDEWSTVVPATASKDDMKIPANTSYRIFKVDVTVEYANN